MIKKLSVAVTVVLYLKKITYLTEIKEENSSNAFLITVNENLCFEI